MGGPPHNLLTWAEAYDAGPDHCGGKGFNLARLARYGFNVPPGGVLSAETYAALLAVPEVAFLVAGYLERVRSCAAARHRAGG